MAMKKFINKPENIVAELLEGVTKQSLKALNSQVAPAMAGGPVGRELA